MAEKETNTRQNRSVVFTETFIKGKKIKTAPEWADAQNPGHRIRSASQTFFYRYRFEGKVEKITLGKYNPDPENGFTLADSRERWRELNAVRQKGDNPKVYLEKQARAQAEAERQAELEQRQKERTTVFKLKEDYLSIISDRKRKNITTRHQRYLHSHERIEQTLSNYLESHYDRQADELTKGDIHALLAPLEEAGHYATFNRTLSTLSGLHSWAIETGWPDNLGLLEHNPCANIHSVKLRSRDRALTDAELRTVLRNLPDSDLKPVLQDIFMVNLPAGACMV